VHFTGLVGGSGGVQDSFGEGGLARVDVGEKRRVQSEGIVPATANFRRAWLALLKHTLNRATVPLARAGIGPFSLVRHVGRKTGRSYETPLLLARTDRGFVAELTYGPNVSWFRNVMAAGRCEVVDRGLTYQIDRITPITAEEGLRAFGNPAALVLRALARTEFRYLVISCAPGDRPDTMRS
jgi:deazaflavin-dependent oxidoreductase (nitroreductase family)